jgi:hypothetical protein
LAVSLITKVRKYSHILFLTGVMFSGNTFYHSHTVSFNFECVFFYVCFSSTQGDVYPVESYESFSSTSQILDAHWGVMTDGDVRSCVLMTLNCFVLARDDPHLIVLISLEVVCCEK